MMNGRHNKVVVLLSAAIISVGLTACLNTKNLINKFDDQNLGFEVEKKGLPSNWILYDPPKAHYTISMDTTFHMEGKQSLKFNITKGATGGRVDFTGFTNEFSSLTSEEGQYKLSFWAKNKDTKLKIKYGGVSSFGGVQPEIITEENSFEDWKLFEYDVWIESGMWLRFEIRIYGEGTFWIDGVKIEKI